jgi:carboxyl-terminal processing protease
MGLAALAALGAAGRAAEDWDALRRASFDLVWSTVAESYFDPTFGGLDWKEVGERYRRRLPEIASREGLRATLQEMLGHLERSHFAVVPRDLAVFAPEERGRTGVTGAEVAIVEGQPTVVRVRDGSPADLAGVKPGSRVAAVGDFDPSQAMASMEAAGWPGTRAAALVCGVVRGRLTGSVGQEIVFGTIDSDQRRREVRLAPVLHDGEWAEPIGNFPAAPIEFETRELAAGILYVRLSAFAPALMRRVRASLLAPGNRRGVILDLRGNPGGVMAMASGVAGCLIAREQTIASIRLRRGTLVETAYPQEGAFLGPVAMLVDGGSASTSEVLAAGLRDVGRARVFGERTAGAALPSAFKRLPTGDLFQFAIGDVRTPRGETIEGVGVAPDVEVPRRWRDLAAGIDAPLQAAMAWLPEAPRADAAPTR